MIVAAESIRGFKEAYLHGSFNDYLNWLKSFGYEYDIVGRKLVVRDRNYYYNPDITALELAESEVADLVVRTDVEFAPSRIRIGYEKNDYETVNGRYEVCGTFEYLTGFINENDNVLELISPYRADSMGIETLCYVQSNKSTDNKSDKDIFIVAVVENDSNYTVYREMEVVDQESGVRMFNAPFTPYFMAKNNSSLLGVVTDSLQFTSTDMSKTGLVAKGKYTYNIYQDIPITYRIFEPTFYNFVTGNHHVIPDHVKRNGLVYFKFKGKDYKGYIR